MTWNLFNFLSRVPQGILLLLDDEFPTQGISFEVFCNSFDLYVAVVPVQFSVLDQGPPVTLFYLLHFFLSFLDIIQDEFLVYDRPVFFGFQKVELLTRVHMLLRRECVYRGQWWPLEMGLLHVRACRRVVNHGNESTLGHIDPSLRSYIMLSPCLEQAQMRVVSLLTLAIHATAEGSFVSCLPVIQRLLVCLAHSLAWSHSSYGIMEPAYGWQQRHTSTWCHPLTLSDWVLKTIYQVFELFRLLITCSRYVHIFDVLRIAFLFVVQQLL